MASATRARLCVLAGAVLLSTGGAAIKLCALTSWQVASFRSGVGALALLWLAPVARRDLDRRALLAGAAYAATMILFVLGEQADHGGQHDLPAVDRAALHPAPRAAGCWASRRGAATWR